LSGTTQACITKGMNQWATSKGFTIVEIIVAITVVAILATIVIVSYDGIQQRTRDSQRESDITQLKIAIEKYHAENSEYPDACGNTSGCSASNLSSYLSPYLDSVPVDPSGSSNQYQYVRNGNSYGLRVNFEAKPACKTGVRMNSGWWGSSMPTCG